MTSKLQIENTLWNACNSFRTKIDSVKYKDYVLAMFFIKYLSDAYKENPTSMNYKLSELSSFDYLYASKKQDNIGNLINDSINLLEQSNEEKLKGIFGGINFNSNELGQSYDKVATLSSLLDTFNVLDLSPSKLESNDILGDAYMFLIDKVASSSSKSGGEFYTPAEVSEVLANIVLLQDNESIYDPTCGSGSLLIRAYNTSKKNNVEVYGQERNYKTWGLSRMNMFLHQINKGQIWLGDTIANPQNIEDDKLKTFNCIVANPPFSLDKWASGFNLEQIDYKKFNFSNAMDKYSRFKWGTPPKSKGDYAFILHVIASLKDDGRAAIIMPHGVLFRGSQEGKIRQAIIEHNLLDAVISLPANLFYGTSIPTCILVLRKNKSDKNTLFIDASKEYKTEKKQNKLSVEHVQKILTTYHNKALIDKYSSLVSLEDMQDNDYNLNIPRYINTFEEEEEIDIHQVLKEIKELEAERDKLSKEIDVYLEELGLIKNEKNDDKQPE